MGQRIPVKRVGIPDPLVLNIFAESTNHGFVPRWEVWTLDRGAMGELVEEGTDFRVLFVGYVLDEPTREEVV